MTTLDLPSSIRLVNAHAVLKDLELAMAAESASDTATVVLNAAPLRDFDSSVLALLLGCQRTALSYGRRLEINAASTGLSELARLYGVRELLWRAQSDSASELTS